MAAAFYNQTNSLSFAFIPRKQSEWTQGYSHGPVESPQDNIPAAWYLKEQCHDDFAVLGQFCAKIITLRL